MSILTELGKDRKPGNRKTEWSRKQRAAGNCQTCGRPAETNFRGMFKALCTECRIKQTERMRIRRNTSEFNASVRQKALPSPKDVRYQCPVTGTDVQRTVACHILSLGLLPAPFRRKIKIVKGDTCWHWTGPTIINPRYKGRREGQEYGVYVEYLGRKNGKSIRRCTTAHKFCYQTLVGPIPQGLEPDHLCENKLCVNPSHQEPVTHQENVIRSFIRRDR